MCITEGVEGILYNDEFVSDLLLLNDLLYAFK